MITLKKITLICSMVVIALTMSNCSYIQQANAKNKESLLSAAGYQAVPATTAKAQASLQAMPPYKTVVRNKNGKSFYTYADPKHNLLYVGSAANYQRYKKLGLKQSMADDEIMAETDEQAQMMNWGAWGPVWY
ncbi:MAG: hypothetical protein ABI615_04360 [Chthoniobacterales bacterium]